MSQNKMLWSLLSLLALCACDSFRAVITQDQTRSPSSEHSSSTALSGFFASSTLKTSNTAGSSLVLFRNTEDLSLGIWEIRREGGIASQATLLHPTPPWVDVIGAEDYVLDGAQVILFRDHLANRIYYYQLASDSYSVITGGQVNVLLPTNGIERLTTRVDLAAVGDMDGDQVPDIVGRDQISGQVFIVLLKGIRGDWEKGQVTLGSPVSMDWRIGGVADFNLDGKKDVVMTNVKTGQVDVWLQNGAGVTAIHTLPSSYDPSLYHLAGVYTDRGTPLILLRHLQTGNFATWAFQQLNLSSTPLIASQVPFQYLVESDGERDFKYVNTQAPRANLPVPLGTYYTDQVPDTLDIDERAKLTTFGLQAQLDPEKNYDLLWTSNPFAPQPEMIYEGFARLQGEILDGLALTRMAGGARSYLHVDQALLNEYAKNQSPSGLILYPLRGQNHLPLGDVSALSHVVDFYLQARALIGVHHYSRLTGAEVLPGFESRMLDGLAAISGPSADTLSFGPGDRIYIYNGRQNSPEHPQVGWLRPTPAPPIGTTTSGVTYTTADASGITGMGIQGLAQYHRYTGNTQALNLARGYARYMQSIGFFGPNGEFLEDGAENVNGGSHFPGQKAPHSSRHTKILDSMVDYGLSANDSDTLNFVKKSFEWLRDHPTSDKMIGFFPEFMTDNPGTYHAHAETDELAEMIAIGIKLSKAGAADYWDDLDRWIRNHFASTQVTSRAWIDQARQKGIQASSSCPAGSASGCKPGAQSLDRWVGTWPGWSTPNDWIDTRNGRTVGTGHMACCTTSAARTIHAISKSIVTRRLVGNVPTAQINLLLNKGTREVTVHSYLPYMGRVDVKLRSGVAPHQVRIRAPAWIPTGYSGPGFKLYVQNVEVAPVWVDGRYVTFNGLLQPGQTLMLTADIGGQNYVKTIAGTSFNFTMRGTNVVRVLPEGPAMPLYNWQYSVQPDGSVGLPGVKVVERFVHFGD